MKLKIDFHVHSSRSLDGINDIEDILKAAAERGLDGIALADHNDLSAHRPGSPFILPACECSTDKGHILALFIDEEPRGLYTGGPLPKAEDIIDEIHRLGGLAVWAHPYERGDTVDEVLAERVDLIETANARAIFKNKNANRLAAQLAARLDKPSTGGSDAHSVYEVGNAYTEVDCKDISLDSIKEALLSGKCRPVMVRETPRFRKGLSQLAMRKKKHTSMPGMIKGYVYIIYCLLLDIKSLFRR